MKKTVKFLLSILFLAITLNHAKAQFLNSLTYDVRATNFIYLDTYTGLDPFVTGQWNVIEFDIFIQQTNIPANSEEIMRFKLGTYYINLNFGGLDPADTLGGYASFSYIPGSTTFTNLLALPTDPKCIAIAPTTDQGAFWPDYATGIRGGYLSLSSNFSMGSSSDVQISGTFPGTRVGRYRLMKNITTASPSPFFPSEYTHLRWRVTPAVNLTNPNPVSKIFCNDGLFGPITDVSDKGTWRMDTISINVFPALSGNYTIGTGGSSSSGAVGNYPTIKAAVQDLVLRGVSGPVIFDILSGTYQEDVIIDSIPGSSSINTITFQSQSGNWDDVIWEENQNDFALNLITLNNSDYITFKNISFRTTDFTVRRIFSLNQNCNGINILSNKLNAISFFDTPAYAVNSDNAQTTDLKINNNIINANFGISSNTISASRTQIINNQINAAKGIILNNHDSLQIENNNIMVGVSLVFPDYISGLAISISGCNEYFKISKNKISSLGSRFANSGCIIIDSSICQNSVIVNNFLYYGVSEQGGFGLSISNSSGINVYYNTIQANLGLSGIGSCTNFTLSSSSQCNVKNNIFGGVRTSFNNSFNSSLVSDFNSFYFTPPITFGYNIVYNGTGYTNLNQYQSASNNDLNSTSTQVFFVSFDDLHLAGNSIGNESLVGTPIPGITEDIDGDSRSSLYPYMGADEAIVTLPVELNSFSSVINRRDVLLSWSTLTEISNSGFDIERSKVSSQISNDWAKVGKVKGNGTSNSTNNYSFNDKNLSSGKYKYRLKQIDFNGNFEYFYLSSEVTIGIPQKYELSQNYPNPFNPSTKIDYQIPKDGFVNISVFDNTGKEFLTLVNENKPAGYYTVNFNASSLSSGIYFYKIKSENFSLVKKMMFVK